MLSAGARRTDRGFTLVEFLVTLVLFGILGTIVTSAIVTGLQTTRRGEARVHALNDLQKGVERVGRELRAASPLLLDAGGRFSDAVGATVERANQRIVYRYYLVDMGDGSAELREDVARYDRDSGDLLSSRQGLFIADIGNIESGTPLFTYYRTDPVTGAVGEIDCAGLTSSACRTLHLTANQIRLTLEKLLPEQQPIRVETVVNIRNTRFGTP